jgi:hypothetical protein
VFLGVAYDLLNVRLDLAILATIGEVCEARKCVRANVWNGIIETLEDSFEQLVEE